MTSIKLFLTTKNPKEAEWRNYTILEKGTKYKNLYYNGNFMSTYELIGKITRSFIKDKKLSSRVQDIIHNSIMNKEDIYGKYANLESISLIFTENQLNNFCELCERIINEENDANKEEEEEEEDIDINDYKYPECNYNYNPGGVFNDGNY
jgi:hypothetical protein